MPDRPIPKDIAAWGRTPSLMGKGRRLAAGSPVPSPSEIARLGNVVQFPPTIYPPPDGQTIYAEQQAALTGPFPGPGTSAEIAAFQVPANNVGVIRELTLNINDVLTTTNVRWSLRFNQGGVFGYVDLTVFPRVAASISSTFPPESTLILVPDSTLIDVLVRVVDAGSYLVGATYRGWYFSKETAHLYGLA